MKKNSKIYDFDENSDPSQPKDKAEFFFLKLTQFHSLDL